MIKVSIIIPVYNSESFLINVLDSMINQTLKDIEIICVNDGSTDESLNLLNLYAEKDNRIKVYSQNNQGAGAARNFGLSKAVGETVLFLDSDDIFSVELVENLYNEYKKYNADIVYCNYNILHSNSSCPKDLINKKVFSNTNFVEHIYNKASVFVWNKLFKKEFVDKYNLKFMNTFHSNDIAFVLFALSYATNIVHLDKCLIEYVKHSFSITTKRNCDNFCDAEIYKLIIKKIKEDNVLKDYEKSLYGIMLQSYYDALYTTGYRDKYNYIGIVKKIKQFLPNKALYYYKSEIAGRKFILIKFTPAFVSYYYFLFKNKFTNSKNLS